MAQLLGDLWMECRVYFHYWQQKQKQFIEINVENWIDSSHSKQKTMITLDISVDVKLGSLSLFSSLAIVNRYNWALIISSETDQFFCVLAGNVLHSKWFLEWLWGFPCIFIVIMIMIFFDVQDSAVAFLMCIKINILMCVYIKWKFDPLIRIVHKTYIHDTHETPFTQFIQKNLAANQFNEIKTKHSTAQYNAADRHKEYELHRWSSVCVRVCARRDTRWNG